MERKYIYGIITVIAIIALAVFGLQSIGLFIANESDEIIIGSIQPLTGPAVNVGENVTKAIELAVKEINEDGGINGKELKVIFEDGACDATTSITAAQKLINVDNVTAIIGGACSAETMAAAPVAEEGKTILFSNCSSNPAITNMGLYIFRNYPSDVFQGKIAAEKIYNELGKRKVAVLSCLSDACVGLKNVFTEEFEKLGGEIIVVQEFENGTTDLKTQLLKIKNSNPEIIYSPTYPAETIITINQARELGITQSFFGFDGWDDPSIWEAVGENGNGAMFLTPYNPEAKEFRVKMKELAGETTVCSPQAYDNVKIIAELLRKCGENRECLKEEMYKVNYSGVSGEVSFDGFGDLKTAQYDLKIVKNGIAKTIE